MQQHVKKIKLGPNQTVNLYTNVSPTPPNYIKKTGKRNVSTIFLIYKSLREWEKKIREKKIKLNPSEEVKVLLKYVTSTTIIAISLTEIVPYKKNPKEALDTALLLSFYKWEKVTSTDGLNSKGLFQLLPSIQKSLSKKYKGIDEKCDNIDCQTKSALLLIYENIQQLVHFLNKNKKRKTQFWKFFNSLNKKEREMFMAQLISFMHNAGFSTTFKHALDELLGLSKTKHNYLLNKPTNLIESINNYLYTISISSVKGKLKNNLGSYVRKVLTYKKELMRRNYSNFPLFPFKTNEEKIPIINNHNKDK